MQTSTIFLIVLAAIVALALVLFQYYYQSKKKGKLALFLSFFRFIAVFSVLLLLINPKISKTEYLLEKTNLIVLADNSSSVAGSKDEIASIIDKISTNTAISDQFTVSKYTFGSTLSDYDSLSFKAVNTNISKALVSLNEVYAHTNSAIVLLSDGNQTIGQDYGFYGKQSKSPIFPVVLGDTTQYEDLRIGNVNSNKFAFLKNKYPLEIELAYSGKSAIKTTLDVLINGKRVFRENVKLSNSANVKTITPILNANSVGVKTISVVVSPLENERNTKNNQKNLVLEVIDEKTNIAIVSDIMHPDIGALKKSIESNEQRSVRLIKPTTDLKNLDDVAVFILYQPNPSFKAVYNYINKKRVSVFTITGEAVNASFLNKIQKNYTIEGGYPVLETFAASNSGFSKFDISDFSVDDFPPLSNGAGVIDGGSSEALLMMKILGKTLKSPLLLASDNDNGKSLALFGENIWKWRMQSFREHKNFENFDAFMGKLILYLSSNKTKNRLNIEYQRIYEGSAAAKIKASYFDEAFVFDANASLYLRLKNKGNGTTQEIPMVLKNNYYEADISSLLAADYEFSVTVKDENRSKSGSFSISDFDVEQQFQSSDYKKLTQLAEETKGKLYYPEAVDSLEQFLTQNNRFKPIQKGTENIVSLIDFRLLLALIIAALAVEWFIRKYNGLL